MKTYVSIPSAAPWAATELARLPVEAHARTGARGGPVGADQRRAARRQPAARRRARGRAGLIGEREEVRVAPDVLRAGLDAAAQLVAVGGQVAVVVGHLEGPEAAIADVPRLERILRRTFTTF